MNAYKTPWPEGPYTTGKSDPHWRREVRQAATDQPLAFCGSSSDEDAHALARLLSAAPEFAEGAEAFLRCEAAVERDDMLASRIAYTEMARLLRGALAKAKGLKG